MQSPPRLFEFLELSQRRFNQLRLGRAGAIGIAFLVGGLEVLSFLRISGLLPSGGTGEGQPSPLLIGGGLFLIVMAAMFYFLDFGAYSPVSCELDYLGIHFAFPLERREDYVWSDPRFRLVLVESNPLPRRLGQNGGRPPSETRYSVRGSRPRRWPISAEAFNAVLSECRSRGFRIDSSTRSATPYSQTIFTVTPFS
jgi:hypothetical protein